MLITEDVTLQATVTSFVATRDGLEMLPDLNPLTNANLEAYETNDIDILFLDVKRLQSNYEVLLQFFNIKYLVWIADKSDFINIKRNGLYRLKKPVSPEKLRKLVKIIMNQTEKPEQLPQFAHSNDFYIKSQDDHSRLIHCHIPDIVVVEVKDKTLTIHIIDKRTIHTKIPLSKMEAVLTDKGFIRISQSFIVSKKYIDSVAGKFIHMFNFVPKLKIGPTYEDTVYNYIAPIFIS